MHCCISLTICQFPDSLAIYPFFTKRNDTTCNSYFGGRHKFFIQQEEKQSIPFTIKYRKKNLFLQTMA
uniref:Uncharacterized protein n=1 Tax=Rhizophora mucronata TaxID=61149 RepID=A0A2P2INJ0_RHIMU